MSWLVFNGALVVFLSYAFIRTLNDLDTAQKFYPKPVLMTGTLRKDLPQLQNFESFLAWMSNREDNPVISWLPFHNRVRTVEHAFEKVFLTNLEGYIEPETDALIREREKRLPQSPVYSGRAYAEMVQYLARRVNLGLARLNGAKYGELLKMPLPTAEEISYLDPSIDSSSVAPMFGNFVAAHFAFTDGRMGLAFRVEQLRKRLAQLFVMGDDNMSWLVDWANLQPELKPVTLADFWPGNGTPPNAIEVAPAFTKSGDAAIASFIGELHHALPTKDLLQKGAERLSHGTPGNASAHGMRSREASITAGCGWLAKPIGRG